MLDEDQWQLIDEARHKTVKLSEFKPESEKTTK